MMMHGLTNPKLPILLELYEIRIANQVLLYVRNVAISQNDLYVRDKRYINYFDIIRRDIEPHF